MKHLKKFEDKYSEITKYGNSAMEHNNVSMQDCYNSIEEAVEHAFNILLEVDELDVKFLDPQDEDELEVKNDIADITNLHIELGDLLKKALEKAEEIKEITEKYIQG